MGSRIPILLAFVVGAVMLLGSCAEGSQSGAHPPDSPVASSPSPSGPRPQPTRLLVTPRPGLVDPRPHAWESVEIEGNRTLLIQFYGGVEECYGMDHVDVRYGTDKVTVTLYEGRVPNAGVCIDLAVAKAVRVELREPLAGRKVVDGATPEA